MLEFNQIKEELAANFAELEVRRKEILSKRAKGWMGILVSIVVGFVVAAVFSKAGVVGLFAGAGIGMIGALISNFIFLAGGKREYSLLFKEKIINRMAKILAPQVTYQPQRGVDEGWFQRSELFSRRPDRYSGLSLIHI